MDSKTSNKVELPELSSNPKIKLDKVEPNEVLKDFLIFYISKDQSLRNETKISDNIKKSEFVIIDQNDIKDCKILGFEQTSVIIYQPIEVIIDEIMLINSKVTLFFLSEKILPDNEIDSDFITETSKLSLYMKTHSKLLPIVIPCIAGYLIKKSYFQLTKDRTDQFVTDIKNNYQPEKFKESDYIELRDIGCGSSFKCTLIYHIKRGELYVIKKPIDSDKLKLTKREIENYKKVNHPFLPKFYGTTEENYLVIEYIHGKTLDKINIIQLTLNEKLTIVFELMLIIEYFHNNNMIYRDLKPNNIIIDENKNAVLIDLDNLIDTNCYDISNITNDLSSEYLAPEMDSNGYFSYKSDIYSLGLIIQLIMKQIRNEKQQDKYSTIDQIIKKCTDENAVKRPSIFDLTKDFFIEFKSDIHLKSSFTKYNYQYKFSKISFIDPFTLGYRYYYGSNVKQDIEKAIHYFSIAASQNQPEAQFYLGIIYSDNKYGKLNINKSIYYYTLAANQNYLHAIFNLGCIYYEEKYVKINIKKAIYYFSLAANQNHPIAQIILGFIYHEGKNVERDINKAIYYYSLAADNKMPEAEYYLGVIYYKIRPDISKSIHYLTLATNQDYSAAQFVLGFIYYQGTYVSRDIKKVIHYFTLAANQNHSKAQTFLGLIYYEGKYVIRDINKAIYYYSLAANQNNSGAQCCLGLIYFEGEYVTRDINKAIYYYSLAANQNHPVAQYNLGFIYYDGKYVNRDINKAIYYFSLVANQNNLEAQYSLGVIYYEGKYVTRDIKRAIYYLSLAAHQNYVKAQLELVIIYIEGKYVHQDINKAIYYYTLAANQNNPIAQYNLGRIYKYEKYIKKDINKAIYYYTLAANQNNPIAQYNLGRIYKYEKYIKKDINKAIYYYTLAANQFIPEALVELGYIYQEGKYVIKDINKAIHYYTLAANQNFSKAQYILGLLYYTGEHFVKDFKKSINYLLLSANNGYHYSNFAYGFLLHEGKIINKNIEKAIHYYKEASSFGNNYAKNNLGIIYKYGYDEKIKKNIANSIVYFEEAIQQKNDFLSMYNLAHIYLYNKEVKQDINKAIKLLILSSEKFYFSCFLLSIILIKQFGFDIKYIKHKISEITDDFLNLSFIVEVTLEALIVSGKSNCESLYENYQYVDFVYNILFQPVDSVTFQCIDEDKNTVKFPYMKDISQEFYNGFGHDLS